jgi:hypothetical protein
MIIQPKIPHFAWTKEEVIVQVHGVGPWGESLTLMRWTTPEKNSPSRLSVVVDQRIGRRPAGA